MKKATVQNTFSRDFTHLKSISALILLSHISSACVIVQATVSGSTSTSGGAQSSSSNASPNNSGSNAATPNSTLSADASLSALALTSATLTPAFAAGTLSYAVSVANTVTSISFTPTVDQSKASVKVNNVTVNSGAASTFIALNVGSNTVTVLTTAQDGSTHKTYTITVTRAPSSAASLSSLTLSSGTLSPMFATGTASYTTTSGASSITVTPTVTQANSTVKVNGTTTASGSASATLPMSAGSNTVTVLVTAQDGSTQSTYLVTVYQPTFAGGAQWDSTNSYYRLGTSGSNLELSADWTPAWSNVVGYWKLNESSGTVVTDYSGSNNTGTLSGGATLGISGKIGNAYTMDGSSGYIYTANQITGLNDFSESVWFKTTTTLGGYIIGFSTSSTSMSSGGDRHIYMSSGGLLYFGFFITGAVTVNSANAYNDGSWHHAVATSSTTLGIKLYVDGVLVGSSSSTCSNGTGYWHLGGQVIGSQWPAYPSGTNYFSGTIDDVAIWNTSLSASAINTIYQHQSSKYAGTVTSLVQDALSTVTWSSLTWLPTLPFFKALPNSGVSETAVNYVGYASPTPTPTPLMSGIVGLWHMNGSMVDSSGNGNNLYLGSGQSYVSGLFGSSNLFSSSAAWIDPSTGFGMTSQSNQTYSIWINPSIKDGASLFEGPGAGVYFGTGNGNGGNLDLYVRSLSTGSASSHTNSQIFSGKMNQWHHVAAAFDGTATGNANRLKLYVDGQLQTLTFTSGTVGTTTSGNNFTVGTVAGGSPRLLGQMQELAVWNRTLIGSEILQLYRRGANRLRFQVRSCSDVACSTGSPGWLGPDGTNQTYFSELYNTSNNALTSAVQAVLPMMTFSNAVFSGLGLSFNQYFQYRTIMESDDGNTLCNYGAGATACSPELISVTPTHL